MQTIEKRRKVLGPEHPDSLESKQCLAMTLSGQGRHTETVALMEECVRLQSQILGTDHLTTGVAFERLASIWNEQGRQL